MFPSRESVVGACRGVSNHRVNAIPSVSVEENFYGYLFQFMRKRHASVLIPWFDINVDEPDLQSGCL